ncbi:MAG: ABC transporter permease subunit [Candidatus Hydrogenedentes bacterium]|nr:ABC transporter permease subunit [Candidatus Hydrogenedentota bacterium]
MRNTWAVCKREFMSYFITPIGYVVVGTYTAISGVGFAATFIIHCRMTQNPSMFGLDGIPDLEEGFLSPFLVFCGQLVLFIGPLITMRLLAEEKSRGTMELLSTHPLRHRDIIFGKYLAALGVLLVLLAVIGAELVIMSYYVNVEPAVLWFGLLAVFLMSAAFMSLGLFVSAVTRNPITAATMTFGLWFISYILGTFGGSLPEANPAPESLSEGLRHGIGLVYAVFRGVVVELPLDAHAGEMALGIVQPQDAVYYLLFSAFFLFLTFRALESRKWRA